MMQKTYKEIVSEMTDEEIEQEHRKLMRDLYKISIEMGKIEGKQSYLWEERHKRSAKPEIIEITGTVGKTLPNGLVVLHLD